MRHRLALAAVLLPLAACGARQSGSASSPPPAAPAQSTASANTTTVTGLNGTKGDIVGPIRPGSKFSRIQIGMGQKQVADLIGPPTDTAGHITGKAFIPFYFGGDTVITEQFYKGEGQLSFAPTALGSGVQTLVRIINDPSEQGYAH
jgi:hypothetical protein